jgi:hypothetical protein
VPTVGEPREQRERLPRGRGGGTRIEGEGEDACPGMRLCEVDRADDRGGAVGQHGPRADGLGRQHADVEGGHGATGRRRGQRDGLAGVVDDGIAVAEIDDEAGRARVENGHRRTEQDVGRRRRPRQQPQLQASACDEGQRLTRLPRTDATGHRAGREPVLELGVEVAKQVEHDRQPRGRGCPAQGIQHGGPPATGTEDDVVEHRRERSGCGLAVHLSSCRLPSPQVAERRGAERSRQQLIPRHRIDEAEPEPPDLRRHLPLRVEVDQLRAGPVDCAEDRGPERGVTSRERCPRAGLAAGDVAVEKVEGSAAARVPGRARRLR